MQYKILHNILPTISYLEKNNVVNSKKVYLFVNVKKKHWNIFSEIVLAIKLFLTILKCYFKPSLQYKPAV